MAQTILNLSELYGSIRGIVRLNIEEQCTKKDLEEFKFWGIFQTINCALKSLIML